MDAYAIELRKWRCLFSFTNVVMNLYSIDSVFTTDKKLKTNTHFRIRF